MNVTLSIAAVCVVLSALLVAIGHVTRRGIAPCCRGCRFPVDQERPDLHTCPECGRDLSKPGAIIARAPRARWSKVLALALLLASIATALRGVVTLERTGRLDAYKPSWVLAMQFGSAPQSRVPGLQRELVHRADFGMSRAVARSILDSWRRDRAGGGSSRYDPVAETLFASGLVSGLVTTTEVDTYSRGLLGVAIDAPAVARAGAVVPVESRISLMGSTMLRFELERAKFELDGRTLLWQPDPHIIIQDPQSPGAASVSGLSHATTNYLPLPPEVQGQHVLTTTYSVSVLHGRTRLTGWSIAAERPIAIGAEK